MYALNIDPLNPKGNPTPAELRSLGVETVRFTFKDNSSGSQPDPQKVQFYQNQLQQLAAADINALVILSYETYPGKPAFTASDAVWDTYIERLAQRAGQIAQLLAPWQPSFQVWNEPDLPPKPWYEPSLREAVFGRMMRRVYNAIKAIDANLRVAAGGLGDRNPDWLARVIQQQGGHLPADAVAIHPYGLQPERDWPTPDFGYGYIGDLLNAYRQVTPLPILITEIGVGLQDLDRNGQAEYLRRFYTHVVAEYSNIAPEIYWFCYSDGMVYPHGLRNDAGDPNPTYAAYKDAAAPRPPLPDGIMELTAIVNRADYENMLRNYWEKNYIPADIIVDGNTYPGGKISFRGTTSLTFPKKGYKVKFPKKNLYQGHTRRFDLSASYPDKSLIRERLSFDLFNKLGVVSSKAWHVKYTVKSKEGDVLEWGLYTGIEHLDKYFFRNRSRTEGALYKADGGVVNGVQMGAFLDPQPEPVLKILYDQKHAKPTVESGSLGAALRRVLDAMGGDDDEDYSDLDAFIRQIDGWTPDNIHQYLSAVMDDEGYLTWLAVNTLLQSNDTYHKNYYLHNRMEDDKWEIIPWDYDLTFGRNWADYCDGLCDDLSAGTSIKGSAQMTNRLSQRVLGSPVYYQRLQNKLLHLLETEFTEAKLFPKIDAWYAQITPLAHADARKWPTNQEFDAEKDRLKDWIRRRRDFLYREINASPPPELLPDSVITQLSFNKSPLIEGDQVSFKATVRNIGSASTGNTVGVAFLIDDVYVTFGTVDAMEPGEERVIQSVSAWQATLGAHRLKAVVDDVNRYPELSEENNTLELAFNVQPQPGQSLSDVTVQDIAFERAADGRIQLAALIANIGSAVTADVVGVAFFVDDQYATFGIVDPISAGKARAVRANDLLPLTGVHKITAIVDDINRFPEEREDNNSRTETIDFGTPAPQLADVIVLDVNMGQGRFSEGDPVVFEALVKNIGSATTGDVVGVAFLVDNRYITYGSAPPIEAGQTRSIRAVSPWTAAAGTHRLTAVADDVNRFPEASEDNNRFELDFQVFDGQETRLPDSTVEEIGFEEAGGQITLNATVANIGPVPTPDVVGVAFFVDDVYRTYGITQPMAPGAREVIRAVQSLPLSGTRKITAIVDDINRYDEISHQNNTLSQNINFAAPPSPGGQIERRAVWVTRYDWTIIGKTPTAADIDRIVANIAAARFNAIFFQVRGFGDAYYTPGLEPWASRLTGTAWQTLGQDPGWDPLARLIEQAHAAGIEAHAYINVYPAWLPPANDSQGELAPPATQPPHFFDRFTYGPDYSEHPGQYALGYAWRQYSHSDTPMPLEWGRYLYASPGVDQVRDHIIAVAADIAARYQIDGLHLDHIRYAGSSYSFDPASNAAAGEDKTPQREQWQRDRISDLVNRVSQQVKSIRQNALISAAVWPYYRDKWGWNLSEGYSDYYQDSKGWLASGIIDAIAPMLYGGISDDFAKWQTLMQDFTAGQGSGHVYPGIGANYDDFNAIVQRLEAARQAGAPGHAIFSYGALERRGYLQALADGPYAQQAVLP